MISLAKEYVCQKNKRRFFWWYFHAFSKKNLNVHVCYHLFVVLLIQPWMHETNMHAWTNTWTIDCNLSIWHVWLWYYFLLELFFLIVYNKSNTFLAISIIFILHAIYAFGLLFLHLLTNCRLYSIWTYICINIYS